MNLEELTKKDKEIRDKILELRLKIEYFRNNEAKINEIKKEIELLNREWRTIRFQIAQYNNNVEERGIKL